VKLFKKPKSKFYWYDFTVRGRRCGTKSEGWVFPSSRELLGTCAQSIACSGRRAVKPAFRKNWFFIVRATTTALGSLRGPGTWLLSCGRWGIETRRLRCSINIPK
jgi:hypothetical protein